MGLWTRCTMLLWFSSPLGMFILHSVMWSNLQLFYIGVTVCGNVNQVGQRFPSPKRFQADGAVASKPNVKRASEQHCCRMNTVHEDATNLELLWWGCCSSQRWSDTILKSLPYTKCATSPVRSQHIKGWMAWKKRDPHIKGCMAWKKRNCRDRYLSHPLLVT